MGAESVFAREKGWGRSHPASVGGDVPPQSIDPATLEHLKRQATGRAETLGHRLQPFRAAKHDPLCYVSFCRDCRQMVIVSLQQADSPRGALYGYALEARCASQDAEHGHLLAAAGAP
jgi:hypothetical protein